MALLCRDERDARRSDIEHLATNLVGKVNECVAAIDEGARAFVRETSFTHRVVGPLNPSREGPAMLLHSLFSHPLD